VSVKKKEMSSTMAARISACSLQGAINTGAMRLNDDCLVCTVSVGNTTALL